MKRQTISTSIAIAVSLAIAGCASAPKTYPDLEAARVEVQQATSEPLAQEAAGIRLKQANDALIRADEAVRTGQSQAQIQQDSLLAMRNAQIAKEQIAEMKARKSVEEGQAARNQVLLQAREQDVRTAQLEADKAKQQAATAADATAHMRAELEALQAKQTERGMVLTLGDVLFATGQATLQPGAMRVIDQLATFMDKYPDATISVEGHTDSVGNDDFNLSLSQHRAEAVQAAVVGKGIDVRRVTTRGLGESLPVGPNTDAAGRQQNRRVEIVFANS